MIYTTPSCQWCRITKEYFKEHGVKYTEHNVAADYDKAREMIEKSGQVGVPVTEINGKIIIGYDVKAIEKALKK